MPSLAAFLSAKNPKTGESFADYVQRTGNQPVTETVKKDGPNGPT